MGRLSSRVARMWLTAAMVLLLPALAWVSSRLVTTMGESLITMGLGLAIAHLLSVGVRGAPVAWLAFFVEAVVVDGRPPSLGLVVLAAVQAAIVVGGVRLLELRFAHHGPVRSPVVMIEFALIGAAVVPIATELTGAFLGPVLVGSAPAAPALHRAAASGLGVLGLTAGVRMVVMGQHRLLGRSAKVGLWVAVPTTVVAWMVVLATAGPEVVVSAQYVILPILAVALLVGTVGYSIGTAATMVGIAVPMAIAGVGSGWRVPMLQHWAWWLVGFAGLLLATYGDRRRAIAAEFESFFRRSATPSLSVNRANGRILLANDAVADLLGVPAGELVGRDVVTLLPDAPGVRDAIAEVVAGERSEVSVEVALRTGPGIDRWVRLMAHQVELGGPQHDVVQVQLLDLTAERARAEALERANEALERFGRRVTHDLKQPVSAIAGYAGTLLQHGDRMDPVLVRTMYERLEAAATRAANQLDDTYAAAASTGEGPVDVHLHELVASVVGILDIDLAEAKGTVDTALAAAHVHAEPMVLRQVLLNLLTNSLKYARDERPPRIRISSRVRGPGVEITVTDNGAGIPAEQLDAIFDRGVRLEPGRAQGRGDGLADSRDLAERAGGWLRAEPWPDGARLVLWLPDASMVEAQTATRVLVVEDDPIELERLRRRLDLQPSITVVGTAGTVRDAVSAARSTRPDVVLLDRWLEDVDGLSGVVELARAHRDARIILLTDETAEQLEGMARTAGVLRTIDRAVDDDELIAQLVEPVA